MKRIKNKMKLLLAIIIIFSFQSWTKADDIREFQIEGISIGDSLLDFMTKEEILSSKRNYEKDRKYYVVGYDENLKNYTQVDVYLKSGDSKYIVRTLSGALFMNVDACLTKKKKIVNELRELFSNASEKTYHDVEHSYDKTGNSLQHQTGFLLKNDNNDDHIRVECMDWSDQITKKNQWTDSLSVGAYNKEILQWFISGYN